ncbi:MAG TPA: Uma2 family endonuclease [Phototrophicaceae bacterium]|nr:Uma2 family endonuclease [Phototrophicaceae bacterium]
MAIPRTQSYTVDEFEAFINRPENTSRLFELINGEVVEKVPTEEHSLIVGNLYLALRLFVDQHGLGRVAFEVRRRVPDDEHNARLPDAEFTSKERLLPVVKRGAVPQMPDLAVEVQSPTDSPKKLLDKAAYYLANGSRMVWLVYPDKRLVEVLTVDDRQFFTETEVLSGGDVLPGFSLPVQAIFRLA